MFASRYFAPRYFAPRYFAEVGASPVDNVITYVGKSGYGQCISGIMWAYDTTPIGGRLTIQDGNNIVFDVDIPNSGPGFIHFNPALEATIGNTLTITLTNGSTTNKLNVFTNFLRAQ